MKKKHMIWIAFISMVLGMLLSVTVQAAAVPSKATVTKAYTAYKKKYHLINTKQFDFDGNGIKELIYRKYGYDYIGIATYNPKTRKVVKLKSFGGGKIRQPKIYYNKAKKYFTIGTVSTQVGVYTVYKLNGTKLSQVKKFEFRMKNPVWYKINNKKVSAKKFNSELDKIFKWKYVAVQGY